MKRSEMIEKLMNTLSGNLSTPNYPGHREMAEILLKQMEAEGMSPPVRTYIDPQMHENYNPVIRQTWEEET